LGEEIPYVQTIFSPLSVAKKLAGPQVFDDLREHPDLVHQALESITETTVNFVKANISAGVAGFFFATQCATTDFVTEKEYDEFGVRYDLKVLEAANQDTFMNILHIHGPNIFFKKLSSYPVNCLNWHDRWVPPTMSEARVLTDKCFLGGINERYLVEAAPESLLQHVQEAIEGYGDRKGVILTPGCVCKLDTPEINFYALRIAVEQL
jgi:uroporphyrinogen decarboxylase